MTITPDDIADEVDQSTIAEFEARARRTGDYPALQSIERFRTERTETVREELLEDLKREELEKRATRNAQLVDNGGDA